MKNWKVRFNISHFDEMKFRFSSLPNDVTQSNQNERKAVIALSYQTHSVIALPQ